ncbi:glycerophosphoryl diester phosphodiesterase [Propionibacterium freudenreichii]|nr:glycerophosphoryl diester phosphodiesterase [Propionibacterium freudenreichii]CEI29045.1 glycerophosphoryl diester phosphodiesterase [Propionibacterium freudenreichii]
MRGIHPTRARRSGHTGVVSRRRTADDYEFFDAPFAAMAHRGGWDALVPARFENSLLAFEHAVNDLGYRYVETDGHATADGVLVALHDTRLDRVTDMHGAVAGLPWRVVRRARIGGSEPVPTMDEVFEALPNTRINIDIKESGAIAPLAAAIRAHRAEDRVCVASFSPRRLAGFRALMGDRVATSVSVGAVAWSAYVPWLPRVLNSGAQVFQIPTSQAFGAVGIPVLTRNLARVAASRAMRIHVWTIDQSDEMVQLMDSGVDGIVSNRIDVLRRVARERALW